MVKTKQASSGMTLAARFALLITCILICVLGLYLMWSVYAQKEAAENKALAEARVLNGELNAIWDYINDQQNRINYNSDGSYDFKGVYCTIAAKNIAQRFMRDSDYVIRYVRENPRTYTDEPDDFEREAIEAYRTRSVSEYYDVTVYEGEPALRYSTVLLAEFNCLKCHGEPAGELDEVGYLKEGMKFGDLAGLTSIVIPLSNYDSEVSRLVMRDFTLAALLVTTVCVAVWIGLKRWVTRPLNQLNHVAYEIGKGNFDTLVDKANMAREISGLSYSISEMASDLEESYCQLEEKVANRTTELSLLNEKLKSANQKLIEANDYKSDFLTIVSHELRTPMTAIMAFTDILGRSSLGEEEQQMVGEVRYNARVLLGMINNIIDAARIEAGKYELHVSDVDIVDVINAVESMVTPLTKRKGVSIVTSVASDVPVISSDRDALYKIVSNLAGNAIKFTEEGGAVRIRACCAEESIRSVFGKITWLIDTERVDKDTFYIAVEDTGIGIGEGEIERVFERFVQPDSSLSRRYGGSGLGLSIVRDLVVQLGGKVGVVSSLGRGSLFVVCLPLRMDGVSEREGDLNEASYS